MPSDDRVSMLDWWYQRAVPADPRSRTHAERGHQMAVRAGAAIRKMCRAHGLPQPTAVLSSPLLRCAQTCASAVEGGGFAGGVGVEPSLCETICEDWYRSWGVPGADGKWGGPEGVALVRGDTTPPPGVHPAALGKVSDLFLPPAALTDAAGVLLDETYCPFTPAASLDYSWGRYEAAHGTDVSAGRRIGTNSQKYSAVHRGST